MVFRFLFSIIFLILMSSCSEKYFSPSQANDPNIYVNYIGLRIGSNWMFPLYNYGYYLSTNLYHGTNTVSALLNYTSLEGRSITNSWFNFYNHSSNESKMVNIKVYYPDSNTLVLNTNYESYAVSAKVLALKPLVYYFSNDFIVIIKEIVSGREVFYGKW